MAGATTPPPRSTAARLAARAAQALADHRALQLGLEPGPEDPRWEGDPATDGVLVEEWDPDEALDAEIAAARREGRPYDAQAAARRALEKGLGPFSDEDWRLDLARFREGGRTDSQRLVEDADLLHGLARRVPRHLGDTRGASPWTSFLREVAVARGVSARAAQELVQQAVVLVEDLPAVASHLGLGLLPVPCARALLEVAVTACGDEGRAAVDGLASRACLLPAWQVRQEALRALLAADADAAAARAARAARSRHVRTRPLQDEQAELVLQGPAVPVGQAWAAVDADARALKAAGDPRTLEQLRFDLSVQRLLADHLLQAPAGKAAPADTSCPRWLLDQRFSRPVQVLVTVPVTTARGLADDPAYLAGYGWISAPSARLLLPAAELRQLCTVAPGEPGPGTVLDRAQTVVRPAPSPGAVAAALEAMMREPFPITAVSWQEQSAHDPPPALAALVRCRDAWDDGPLADRVPAARCDLDHGEAHPRGPTAAWNLYARSRRTHLLKHLAWDAVRTAQGTVWTSPAGQTTLRPTSAVPVAALAPGAALPDPVALHAVDTELVTGWPDDEPPF